MKKAFKLTAGRGFRTLNLGRLLSCFSLSLPPLLAALVIVGCGKSSNSPPASTPTIDPAKLRAAFPSPSHEIHKMLDKVVADIRYDNYTAALGDLGQLASDPSLTEPQKKVVNDALEQAKKMAATQAPKPAQ